MLNLMAAFAEYERELIQKRVLAGVETAKARGVKFGQPAPDAEKVGRNLRMVRHLIVAESLNVEEAARTVGWSKGTYYRLRSSVGRGM